MTTLREAAQQALEALMDDCLVKVGPHSWERRSDLAITALRAALAESVQEPIGYWQGKYSHDGGAVLYEVPQVSAFGYTYRNIPLYTVPPQRKPLTLEEIRDMMDQIPSEDIDSWSFRQGVASAEQAHGIGDNT